MQCYSNSILIVGFCHSVYGLCWSKVHITCKLWIYELVYIEIVYSVIVKLSGTSGCILKCHILPTVLCVCFRTKPVNYRHGNI